MTENLLGSLVNWQEKYKKYMLFLIVNIMTIAAMLLNSSWMYNRLGDTDHFSYLGAAVYFPKTLSLFPNHPIIELVPTYALTSFLYHYFPPETANFIKDYCFLVIFLYMFVSFGIFITGNVLATILAAIILSSYYYFLQSIGSDYTDSFIQIFILAHLYLIKIIYDKKARTERVDLTLVLLGVVSGLMLSTGVMSLVYVFNLLLFFISLALFDYQAVSFRSLLSELFIWLLGLLSCVLVISLYLYIFVDGYFMRLNIAKLFNFVAGHGQFHPLMEWAPFAAWLILPSSILLFFIYYCIFDKSKLVDYVKSLVALFKLKRAFKLLTNTPSSAVVNFEKISFVSWAQFSFGLFIVSTSLSLIFIQFIVRQWSLQFMYFSQVNFIYYLGLAVIFSKSINNRLSSGYIAFLIIATSVLASFNLNLLSHQEINYEAIATNFYTSSPSILPWVAFFAAFSILIFASYKGLAPPYVLIFSILLFNLFSYSELHGLFCCVDSLKIDYLKSTGTTSEKYFDANFKISKFLDTLDKDRVNDVWFDERERLGPILKQVFAMNYLNMSEKSLINKNMPDLAHYHEQFSSAGHDPVAGKNILLISESSDKLSQAIGALQSNSKAKIDYETFDIVIGKTKLQVYKTK